MHNAPDIAGWYARYAARLRGAARRIVGNDQDAEDATQEAFLAAFRSRDRYLEPLDPYPWLYRIAQRKALTIASSRRSMLDFDTSEVGSWPSAEDEAVARDEARRVRGLVARDLPVALHLMDGLRFREVSALLHIPAATAATRIRRGKHRLRALLTATDGPLPRSKSA